MRLFVQNENCPSQVLFAFDEVADSDVERVRWAVAYATLRGCRRLVDRIAQRIGVGQWHDARKRFVVSLDYAISEPGAIEYLNELPNSRVRIAGAHALETGNFSPARAYHPKVYLFDSPDATHYVIGSANLTESAMINNVEVVTTGLELPENGGWNAAWRQLIVDTTALTPEIIQAYARLRQRQPKVIDPEPAPHASVVRAADQSVLWDAIHADQLFPVQHSHFWVEAGSMSSGGSRNQLELPRGANVFFGFNFDNYDSEHSVIGVPVLTIGPSSWHDRRLTWHGNNRMERINLPTIAQGGFDYVDTAILFRRKDSGFEVLVAGWNDPVAKAWRSASARLTKAFRLGQRGERICGFF